MIRDNFTLFIFPNELQKETLCYSDGMGFENNPGFYINRVSFNNYLIMHTLFGQLCCEQNGENIAVNSGESILLDLHEPHIYYFAENVPTKIAWTHINGLPASNMMAAIKKLHSTPIKTNNSKILEVILSLYEISDQPNRDIFQQSEHLYALLSEFLKEEWLKEQDTKETPRQIEFKKSIWHYISHNLYRDITLDELANSVSLSKYHFIRTFHNAFGVTPMQFIIEEKIRQAKYLLTNTTDPVYQISESLGFSTQSYFSKAFRHETGVSPSDYRKNND